MNMLLLPMMFTRMKGNDHARLEKENKRLEEELKALKESFANLEKSHDQFLGQWVKEALAST